MPGARCARSLACKSKKAHEHSHHGHAGFARHSPRNGFNGFLRALPGGRLVVTVVSRFFTQNLTPASGRQDHTTSPSASVPFVSGTSASIASRPAFVTIAKRPCRGRDGESCELIWRQRERKYFCERG